MGEIYSQAAFTQGPTDGPTPTPTMTPQPTPIERNCSGTCTYGLVNEIKSNGKISTTSLNLLSKTCKYGCSCPLITENSDGWIEVRRNDDFIYYIATASCQLIEFDKCGKCKWAVLKGLGDNYFFRCAEVGCYDDVYCYDDCKTPKQQYTPAELKNLCDNNIIIETDCHSDDQFQEPPVPTPIPYKNSNCGGVCKHVWKGNDGYNYKQVGKWETEILTPCESEGCYCFPPGAWKYNQEENTWGYVQDDGLFEGMIYYNSCKIDMVRSTDFINDDNAIITSSGNLVSNKLVNSIAVTGNTTLGYSDGSLIVLNNISMSSPLEYVIKPLTSVIGLKKTITVEWDGQPY
jgi:hypothetical protein